MSIQTRQTHQKQMVLDAVQSHGDHPSANVIYEDVHAQDSKISRATVYRNLGVLVDAGAIQRVRMPGADRFDRLLFPHGHLICDRCDKVIDLDTAYESELDTQVAEKTGYLIEGHYTVFSGLCPACRSQSGDQVHDLKSDDQGNETL